MNEWMMILEMALGGTLFAIGGTGFKWARRFVLPVALGLIAFFSDIEWWRDLGMTIGLIVAFHLPYGERTPYWGKAITAMCFTLPTLFFGFSLWQIFTPLAFLSMFWLSNNRYFSRLFPWKCVEFLTGTLVGVTVSQLLSQTY